MFRRIAGHDTPLWAAALAIVALSVTLLMTSISDSSGHLTRAYGIKQLVIAVVAAIVASFVARLDIEVLQARWKEIYLLCIASIGVVFLLGAAIRGSRRWLNLGLFNFQPSEFGKVLIILAVAGYIAPRIREMHKARQIIMAMVLVGLPAVMVFIQPDFGTSQIYGFIFIALIYFAGARWKHLGIMFGTLICASVLVLGILPALGLPILKDYQIDRLTSFMNPDADPRGTNYHVIQGKNTIGSGGLLGKSDHTKSQVELGFLPEAHTDFIFPNLVEKFGFVGGAVLLALYTLLISRCLRAVAVAPTIFGRLVCGAIAVMFFGQVFINIGMTLGIMPVTGVPLPLFSYGGSAMVANLMAVGVVAAVLRSSETAPVRYARRIGPYGANPTLKATLGRQRRRKSKV